MEDRAAGGRPGDRRRAATRYTLGDSPLAGDRLALLGEVFDPTTRALVRAWRPAAVRYAVDLGCGPGHSTHLVAAEVPGAAVVGLDASPAFVERAALEADAVAVGASVHFAVHDATRVPFPTPPADLILARYLLTHLPDPVHVVGRWVDQLAPGGRLLVDEVEAIDTEVDVFATYLDVSGRMIAAQGADLYVGGALPAGASVGAPVLHDATVPVAPPTAKVARLFGMNLATWRHDPWVVAHVPVAVLDGLAAGLDRLATVDRRDEIVWRQRQVVYEAPPSRDPGR